MLDSNIKVKYLEAAPVSLPDMSLVVFSIAYE